MTISVLDNTGRVKEQINLAQVGGAALALGQAAMAASVPVVIANNQSAVPVSGSVTVSGTATVSGTVTANAGTNLNTSALALESGGNLATIQSNTAALDLAQNSNTSGQTGPLVQGAVTTGAPSYNTGKTSPLSLTTTGGLRVDGSGVTQPVSGTFWQATQPISAASLPLPSGAATAAKQPALGTAGSASADVLSVQGVASMTALKVDGSGVTQPISGTVATNADGTAAAGTAATKSLLMGGQFNTTLPTLTNGQQSAWQFSNHGSGNVAIMDGIVQANVLSDSTDGGGTSYGLDVVARGQCYNGASWDLHRNNYDVTLLASGGRTATTNSADQINYNGRSVIIYLDITTPGTGTGITVFIQGKNLSSGKYFNLNAGVAQTSGKAAFIVGLVGAAIGGGTGIAQISTGVLPRVWRVSVTASSDSSAYTYSVDASVLV
jgi:hypothetical protein